MSLHALSAVEAAAAIGDGRITSRELVDACLARIAETEDTVKAWAFLDPEHARHQADDRDARHRAGRPGGPLHGVPVGVKDIIDSADMPTEYGSPLYHGHRPRRDATVISRLRAAGAVILGKTATTEFAAFHPTKTTNPYDPTRTPGGSSSGSAAAVAAGMVPLAIGTQTKASIVRPAAFCGVHGFKPSFGMISRQGVLRQSRALDHIGVFARDLGDAALVAEALIGHDPGDPDTGPPLAAPALGRILAEEPPVAPKFAFVKTPFWSQAEPAMVEACGELVEALGERVDDVDLPEVFERCHDWYTQVFEADVARSFRAQYARGADQISASFKGVIERGREHKAIDYNDAIAAQSGLNEMLDEIFDAYDAILTPAAPGEAPVGLETTGNPIFGTIWTFTGTPALSLPLFRGESGLPMGLQVVGQNGDDGRLLRSARWLLQQVSED